MPPDTGKIEPYAIAHPQLLQIKEGGLSHWGGSQDWYPAPWKRQAGCGPTACAHLLWYLAQTRTSCRALCPWDASSRAGFLRLMEEVWGYVTPGAMGVNSTALFVNGAMRYGRDRGIELAAQVLELPIVPPGRVKYSEIQGFLQTAFGEDLPVAFLNLSNGALDNLESWHWVTLVALEDRWGEMLDQAERKRIDLKTWRNTTLMGGGLVCLSPAKQ